MNAVRSLWTEPSVPKPPGRVWRDWALVSVLVPAAVLEGIFREELVWRPLTLLIGAALVFTLLWRRTHPLASVAIAMGSTAVVDAAAIAAGVDWTALSTTACLLLLPYALFRWGAGREAAIGLTVILVSVLLSALNGSNVGGDFFGGSVIVLFTASLGASVRYQDRLRLREIEQVKLREREQLARELHDTVAHHVSAIAVQAQAGRALASSRPESALNALEVIEEEASRTLTEMRSMVGALRRDEAPDLAPQPGVADIEQLAFVSRNGPRIDVELSGALDDLRSSLDAALYRLAQESITNAVRHARNATRIHVRVRGERDCVRLTVDDDGDPSARGKAPAAGYGVVGMSERAKLLGGTLEAGPSADRGWTVAAVLPKRGTGA